MAGSTRKKVLLFLMLAMPFPALANEVSPEELERWFSSDEFGPPRYSTGQVNDGILQFLDNKPEKPVHHHRNSLKIYPRSLEDGWVKMDQCHYNMDQIERAEVVFREGRVRELRVVSSRNIERAWVEDNTIQIKGVKIDAQLCLAGWTRALLINEDGSYTLHNGPYMRRFLDGYFPMHVSMDVTFSGTGLKFVDISPVAQDGFKVTQQNDELSYDAWFKGRLKTRINFSADIL